jgi:hypothetical protein
VLILCIGEALVVCFVDGCLSFCLFFAIVLSVLPSFMDSGYLFFSWYLQTFLGIFRFSRFCNYSDSVVFFGFLDFVIVQTVWYFSVF